MPATITANVTAAVATEVRPRLSVSVVNAKGNATASVAAANVEYIELALGAFVDTSGRFKYVSEMAVVLDAIRITAGKTLASSFGLQDSEHFEASKALSHAVSVGDAIAAINAAKTLADEVGLPEQLAFAAAKALADSVSAQDSPSILASKVLASAFSLTDSQSLSASKALASSFGLVETFYSVLVFIRSAADSISVADASYFALTKAPFASSVSASDVSAMATSKLLADGVAMDDGTSIGDGSTYFFEKNLHNLASVSDALILLAQKSASDSVGTTDSGLALMQGYCDITYFAEDYVGISSSF